MSANIQQVAYEYSPTNSTLHTLLKPDNAENADRVIMALLAIPMCAICSIRNLGKSSF